MLQEGAHPAAPLLRHVVDHGVSIALSWGVEKEEKEAALGYGTHTSALKGAEFIHNELAYQVQDGHVSVFPWEAVKALHDLWLFPVAVIPQVGRRPRLVFDFTWSRLNKKTKRLSPMEAIRF